MNLRVCLLLLVSASSAAAANISGTVTDASTQSPLVSAVVAAYTPAGTLQGTATTDALGHYLLAIPPAPYRVLAYDPSGVFATTFGADADSFDTSAALNVAADLSGINFALRRAGTVNGGVFASATSMPLSGVTVAAYNLSTGTRRGFSQTTATGTYSLVLPPGQYKIAAYDNSGTYAVRFYADQATFASATTVSVTASVFTTAINFRLVAAAHLNGSVVDADTKIILPGRSVIAYTSDGTTAIANGSTDAAGNFSLSVAPGSYKVVGADAAHVYAAGYVADANSFANNQAISVAAGQLVNDLRIPLHRAGTVTGHVADAFGTPLMAITVAGYNDDGTQRAFTQSDPGGAYSLLLPSGSFRIAAYDNSLIFAAQSYASSVAVFAAQTSPSIDFSLIRGTRFAGTITDQSGAVSGISVAAYDDAGNVITTAMTDAAGNYGLVVPQGNYRFAAFDNSLRYVTAYGGGAANFEAATVYRADGNSPQHLDFTLTRGVRVSGSVIDSSSTFSPLSGIQIGALDLTGNRVATAMSKDSAFDLVLAPGTYKLLATDPLQRYYATFYNSAYTLAAATPIVVQSNGVSTPINLLLVRQARHRAAPH